MNRSASKSNFVNYRKMPSIIDSYMNNCMEYDYLSITFYNETKVHVIRLC